MTAEEIMKCKACADNLAQQIIDTGFSVGEISFIVKNMRESLQEKINGARLSELPRP